MEMMEGGTTRSAPEAGLPQGGPAMSGGDDAGPAEASVSDADPSQVLDLERVVTVGALEVVDNTPTPPYDYAELGGAGTELRTLTRQICGLVRRGIALDRELGGHLLRAHAIIPHGGWTPWLAAETGISADRAERLMSMARTPLPGGVTIGRVAHAALGARGVPPEAAERVAALAESGVPITVDLARRIVSETRRAMVSATASDSGRPAPARTAGGVRTDAEADALPGDVESWLAERQAMLWSPAGRPALDRLREWGIGDNTARAVGMGCSMHPHDLTMPSGAVLPVVRGLVVPVRTPTGILTGVHLHDGRRGAPPRLIVGSAALTIHAAGGSRVACPDLATALLLWQVSGGTVTVSVPDAAQQGFELSDLYMHALWPVGNDGIWAWTTLGRAFAPPGWGVDGARSPDGDPRWRPADLRRLGEVLLLLAGPAAAAPAADQPGEPGRT